MKRKSDLEYSKQNLKDLDLDKEIEEYSEVYMDGRVISLRQPL